MDAYDEIFDFLEVSPEKRIACLKHLLNSTRARLPDATKGKIYGRIADRDAPVTTTARPLHQNLSTFTPPTPRAPEGGGGGSSESGSDGTTKSKKSIKDKAFASTAAEELADSNGINSIDITSRTGTHGRIRLEDVREHIKGDAEK